MSARWLLAALLVVSWLLAVNGLPSAETQAAFTSTASARGVVTAARWTSSGPPCLDEAPSSEQRGNACGPPSPLGPPWPPGEPQPPGPPPGRPPRSTSELGAAATSTPRAR